MYLPPELPTNEVLERPGGPDDLQLLANDRWLMNTEVRYHLQEKRSRWHLSMIYIAVDNPFRFICRKIDSYPSAQKARTFAEILQRGIRKDARGTLKSNYDAFYLCDN